MPDETPPPPVALTLAAGDALPALAAVRAAVAPMHTEPRVASPQTSQLVAGQLVLVHELAGDWLRVSGVDGYPAWVHRGYLVDAAEDGAPDRRALDAQLRPAPGRWAPAGTLAVRRAAERRAGARSLGCTVRSAHGTRRLPLGAWVRDADGGPDAPRETVVEGVAVAAAALADRFPRTPDAVAASAAALFAGCSYQWGGVTPWGADCSGFVQAVYRLHGVELPRDAWQQALEGADAGSAIDALGPGDLLFFSDRDDRRVTHVGVALGGSRMAHVSLGRGGFAVERLDGARDPYVARLVRQLCATRRVV